MAGNSGHNLSISKHRRGCRLPHECSGVGDNYAKSGEVKIYRLTPEEIAARYGPPVQMEKPNRKLKINREYLEKYLQHLTVAEVAVRLQVPKKIVFELAEKYGLELDEKNRLKKECENMDKLPNEPETVSWITPYKPTKKYPIIRFYERGISLNLAAIRDMDGVRHLKVGVVSKTIILAPTEESAKCYKLGKASKNNTTIKIGGGMLAKQLTARDIKYGRYRLTKNEAKGWWEAQTAEGGRS